MLSHRHRVAALVAVAALLGGCTEKTAGTASAGAVGTTAASGTSVPTSTTPPVSRPKAVDLKGVDSCAVLSDAQKQQFGLTRTPGTLKSSAYQGATLCSIGSADFTYGIGVVVAANEGVELFEAGVASGELTPLRVGGFPALTGRSTAVLPTCTVYLDLADGQLVDLGVNSTKVPMDELCTRAKTIAEAVVQTLTAS
ncbi:DUF3558 domain-containing protein [Umezawaea sp. Da 62-37]|uniref:DUF3558 domain-containing protein n=1 Tax=Umezawaea sp. Da 62-37 TaxID=3075927 RepID=UPI0028F6FEE7|nr:DUF3558 domain-containing protein [Umezawaea sp. Da 62-37]WNV91192.1 DUF3558 domain-containing protein [Umezawaea sp. Da 62-37]